MLNYAIIGCGRISYNHFAAAIENNLNIVAVCDIVSESMTEKLNRYNLKDVMQYTDYKEMIAREDIDLIAICTESGKHGEISLYCLEQDIHLIVEKPIALSLNEVDTMIALAEEKELVLCACHQNRFNKSIAKIREALEAGRFGKLFHGAAHVRWNRGKEYYAQADWRGTWGQDGGALMNQCIHNIDILRWMMGEDITEVMAYTDRLNHDYLEAEDLGLAIVKFANGSYGLIEGTTNVYPKNLEETLYIFGSEGTVKAGGKSVNIIEEWMFNDELDDPEEVKELYHENPPNVYGFGHNPLYADVIDSITNNRSPYIDGQAGRDALELVLAIYKSAATGKPVKLPLAEGSTLDFVGRFDK